MSRAALPRELLGGPFTVSRAMALGVSRKRLRGVDLHTPTRGVRSTTPIGDEREWAAAIVAAGGFGVALSHATACRIWSIPLPRQAELPGTAEVIGDTRVGRMRRAGVKGHRGIEHRSLALVSGLPVTDLPDTWVDLGEMMPRGLRRIDLIIAGDHAATALNVRAQLPPHAPSGVRELQTALARRVRHRGARHLREALGFVRPGVRSPQESVARMLFVDEGLPEPEVNQVITDARGGWLAEGDLVWREQRVVAEYQGERHAERRRRSADSFRRELLADQGWRVIEIWHEDLATPARRHALLARVAAALGLDEWRWAS